MMSPTLMAFAPFPTALPMTRHINPGHDLRDESAALDLCTKKRPPSPNFPYDYKNPQNFSYTPSISPKTEVSDVSSSEDKDYNSNITHMLAKRSRPFKVYPKNPISVAMMGSSLDNIFGKESAAAYAEFRQKMLAQAQSLNHNGTNKNMRRTQSTSPQMTDPTYREKRQKNNEAAKRSRDARRAKEDEIAIRCAFLEQENLQLKCRLATLEKETERLQNILYK